MSLPPPDPVLFVGIDIAAQTAQASWLRAGQAPSSAYAFPQTPAGFAALRQRLAATGVPPADTLVVVEATGSYWCRLALDLHSAGYPVAVINPAQAHYFAQAQLRRAKTDALDAQLLAQFAASLRPAPWTPPPALYHELEQRLQLRQQFLEARQVARNQLHALQAGAVVIPAGAQRLAALVQFYEEQLRSLEAELCVQVSAPPDPAAAEWATNYGLLLSIKGIGRWTALWLLVATVNFTSCATVEQAVGYAGLAPMARQSGTSVRGREHLPQGGHARLRTALYMATLSAARYNPAIRQFYDRLRTAGKPAKVARCAAARKLLHLAWAVVHKRQAYDPAYEQRRAPRVPAAAA
jgi:transposase